MTQKDTYCIEHAERLSLVEGKVETVEKEVSKLDDIKTSIISLRHDVRVIKWAIFALAAAAAGGDSNLLNKLATSVSAWTL